MSIEGPEGIHTLPPLLPVQLTLRQGDAAMRAIAWRWGSEDNLPQEVDVAFQLRLNRWNGTEQLQLELAALRASSGDGLLLERCNRHYWVSRDGDALVIRNAAGEELRGQPDRAGGCRVSSDHPSGSHPYVQALLQDAAMAMGLAA